MSALLRYLDEIEKILARVRQTQLQNMHEAAQMLADATTHQNNLFVFGCNHAGLLALELYYRTGGLVNMNPIRGPGLNLEVVPATMTSQIERMKDYGRMLIDYSPIAKDDVIIIHSVSGRNSVTVDAAIRAKEIGAKVIVLTNMETSRHVSPRHENGINLYQVADIVIDNCGHVGDAALEITGVRARVGPTSTAIGAVILNAIISETVEMVVAAGHVAPVFVSANIDGGDEHNRAVLEVYKKQVFYM